MPKIDLGAVAERVVEWVQDNLGFLVEAISIGITSLAEAVTQALTSPPEVVWILVLTLLALFTRRVSLIIYTVLAFLLIAGMQVWTETMQTLALVVVAAAIAVLLAIPLGILAALSPPVSATLRPILDLMQTLPVFVYLIPAVFFFGIGPAPGVVATIIFALPPGVRLTELGIKQVDKEVVEAAQAFGARRMQILRGVQLPLATRSIMAGVNQVIMLALSMVVVAGLVGAEGLGTSVVRAVSDLDVAGGFQSGLAVVILAVYLDRLTHALSEPKKRRRSQESAETLPAAEEKPSLGVPAGKTQDVRKHEINA